MTELQNMQISKCTGKHFAIFITILKYFIYIYVYQRQAERTQLKKFLLLFL